MTDKEDRIRLERGRWYGWQMWPGYSDSPYASPILVHDVTPLKTGGSRLKLVFDNALYAPGVQEFELTLRVLARRATYLMAELEGDPLPRDVVITQMTLQWLKTLCPDLAKRMRSPRYGPTSAETQHFLTDHFCAADRRRKAPP